MTAFPPISNGTLGALLRTFAERTPDAEALVYPAFVHAGTALRLTATDLDRRVDDLARALVAAGVAPGEHVALWAANVPDWVPLEFALARIGAVLVTVNTALSKDEAGYVLEQSHAVAVLHTTRTGSNEIAASLDALAAERRPGLAGLRLRAWLPAGPDDRPPDGASPLEDLVERARELPLDEIRAREAATRATDVVNIQYTSGTTGFPKGVMLSHRNLIANAHALGRLLDYGPADRVALAVPLFHCFGCAVCVLGAFTHGATLCCLPGFDPGHVLRLVEEERITILHGVPTMFSALLAHPDLGACDRGSLRAGVVGGAACPDAVMRRIVDEIGVPGISAAYGLTESSPGICGSPPDAPLEQRCATVGVELPGVAVQITDPETGDEVPDGAEGELWARGYNIMVGYHDDEDATRAAITDDGWLRTGDLATRGPDGCLRIVGRIKDIVIRGGENIAPAEIEAVVREHADVVECAVVGVPHETLGEDLAAAVVLRDGADLDADGYRARLEGRVASFKIPATWLAFDVLPLTGSGKVKKFELREQILERLGIAG